MAQEEGNRIEKRTMTGDNKDEWNNLSWKDKVQICQQGIAHEDTLLFTYVVIFIGLEALFLTAIFSGILPPCAKFVVIIFGFFIALYFICIF